MEFQISVEMFFQYLSSNSKFTVKADFRSYVY